MAKVRYIAQRKDVERVTDNINKKKQDRVKPKKKPKRFKRYVGNIAKYTIKKQLKKPIKKAKKKLKEVETTESESISNLIGSTEKISKTLNGSRKLAIKGYRVIKKVKLKNSKPKFKVRPKVNNETKRIKLSSKTSVQKQRIKIKRRTDIYIKRRTDTPIKLRKDSNIKLRKNSSKSYFKKISKSNISKSNIDKNILNSRKLRIKRVKLRKTSHIASKYQVKVDKPLYNDITSCKNVKEIVERKKRKRYESSKKVSKLDTFSLNNDITADSNITSKAPNKQSKISEKTKINEKAKVKEKAKDSKKIVNQVKNQEKKKYIINKNTHTKQLKQQSKTLSKTKKSTKNTANKISTKATKNISKILTKVGTGAVKVAGSLLSNPYVLLVIAIILAIIILLSVFMPVSSLFENKPNADTETLAYLIEQLETLDEEANQSIENLSNSDYDKVEYTYNTRKECIYSPPKDFIIYLMLIDENVITRESINTLKMIHEKSYKIDKEVVEEINEETGEETSILNVTVTVYDFDKMLDILGFTQEQKDRADEIQQLPFEKIYPEIRFNEVGEGLSNEEIEAMIGELTLTTANREKLRSVAFTLVDYTVYEWGGKASGSVERPTGLDCSGFIAWVYDRAGITKSLQAGGTAHQWSVSTPISYSELKVGDLGFKDNPRLLGSGVNHVGMYIGDGKWIECYSKHGVGVTSGKSFRYYRKVNGFND